MRSRRALNHLLKLHGDTSLIFCRGSCIMTLCLVPPRNITAWTLQMYNVHAVYCLSKHTVVIFTVLSSAYQVLYSPACKNVEEPPSLVRSRSTIYDLSQHSSCVPVPSIFKKRPKNTDIQGFLRRLGPNIDTSDHFSVPNFVLRRHFHKYKGFYVRTNVQIRYFSVPNFVLRRHSSPGTPLHHLNLTILQHNTTQNTTPTDTTQTPTT
jgi:hypothetical protein